MGIKHLKSTGFINLVTIILMDYIKIDYIIKPN